MGVAGAGSSRERFTAGDPLRALAALAIVVVHVAYQFAFQPGGLTGTFGELPNRFFSALPVAVNVFFVLSGYLITRPYVRAYLAAESPPRIGRYLRNRALRIVPAYWAVLTVLLLIYGTVGADFWGVLGTYAFLQNLFLIPTRGLFLQAWSVIVEVGFYLLVPLAALALTALTRRADRRMRLRALVAALVLAWILSGQWRNAIPESVGPFDKLQFLSVAFLWSFVPGIALATTELTSARARVARVSALPLGLVVVAVAGYGTLMALHAAPGLERSWAVILASCATSGAIVAAPLILQWSGRTCWRWLDNRLLHWVGLRSYSLYLVHVTVVEELRDPVFDVASSGWGAFSLLLALALPASLMLSHLCFELIEQPCLRRRLPWRRKAHEAPASS